MRARQEGLTDRIKRLDELEDHFGLRLARMYAEVGQDRQRCARF